MRSYKNWIIAAGLVGAALAQAQPGPGDQAAPPPPPQGSAAPPQAAPQYVKVSARTKMHASPDVDAPVVYLIDTNEQLVPVRTQGQWTMVENWRGQAGWILSARIVGAAPAAVPADEPTPEQAPAEPPKAPEKARPPDPYIDMPQVLNSPTGWLLPAAVLYSRDGLDTGGGVVSDNRVGLGDVAEFGVSTIDQISAKNLTTDNPSRL